MLASDRYYSLTIINVRDSSNFRHDVSSLLRRFTPTTVLHSRDGLTVLRVMALSILGLRIEQYCYLFLSYWLRMADHDVTNLGTQGPINHLTCGSRLRMP